MLLMWLMFKQLCSCHALRQQVTPDVSYVFIGPNAPVTPQVVEGQMQSLSLSETKEEQAAISVPVQQQPPQPDSPQQPSSQQAAPQPAVVKPKQVQAARNTIGSTSSPNNASVSRQKGKSLKFSLCLFCTFLKMYIHIVTGNCDTQQANS